jgi:hypothetical protein
MLILTGAGTDQQDRQHKYNVTLQHIWLFALLNRCTSTAIGLLQQTRGILKLLPWKRITLLFCIAEPHVTVNNIECT